MFEVLLQVIFQTFVDWKDNVECDGPWDGFSCLHGQSVFCNQLCFRVLAPEKHH